MAEDMRRGISRSMRNGCETSTYLIMQAVFDEWKNNRGAYENLGHLMRTCLLKAGISRVGHEALQIHMALFRDVFVQTGSVPHGSQTEQPFCVNDYFELLCCEDLGWVPFLTEILPCIRLETANSFLNKLTQFLTSKERTARSLGDVRVLLFAVTLLQNITLDLLLSGHGDSQSQAQSLKQHRQLTAHTEWLVLHLKTNVKILLELCSQLLLFIFQDSDLFTQLIENLILLVVMLNPFSAMEERVNLLQDFSIIQASTADLHFQEAESTRDKRDLEQSSSQKGKHTLSEGFTWAEVNLRGSDNTTERAEDDTSQEAVTEIEDSSNSVFCTFNLLNSIQYDSSTAIFPDIINFFLRDIPSSEDFCHRLAGIVFRSKDINIGHHAISSQKMYPWFVKFVQSLVDGTLVCNEIIKNKAELLDGLKVLSLPLKFCDFSWTRQGEINRILQSGRIISGQDNLTLLKMAVENQMCGWRDLLELGLDNTDINEWWKAGFLELVRDSEAILSTEKNVKKLLNVLCKVAAVCENPGSEKLAHDISELFGVMFRRLPNVLQEQVVLSVLGQSSCELGAFNLRRLLKKEEVREQLTVLLNRLTSAGVDKMMSHILLLCLFDADLVMQQVVQVALQNKAQVFPVVEVLRQMASICCIPEPKSSQSKLLFCLHKILSGMVISETVANNLVQMFSLFTETYSLDVEIDSKTKFVKTMHCLLSQSDIFLQFICPSLDAETLEWANSITAGQKKENTSHQPREGCHIDHEKENTAHQPRKGCHIDQEKENTAHQPREGCHIDQEPPCEQTHSEELAEERTKGDRDNPEVHAEHVKDPSEGDSVSTLPLAVALNTLSELLGKESAMNLTALKPFPLLFKLADLYSKNFAIFEGGELNNRRLFVKQNSHKSIALLSTAIWKHCRIFTNADFLWLKQQALKHGWLYIAVMKPVLNIGCDVELHDILNAFARKLKLQENKASSITGLVMLIQLGLVNDEMLDNVRSVIKQSQLTASHSQLIVVVAHILTMSLTTEIYRFVNIIIMLLTSSNRPIPSDSNLLVPDAHKVQASQLLTDAVLQMSTSEMTEDSWCHIISNYQAAVQSLLLQEKQNLALLVDVVCHICMVISATDGRAVHILQVSALDVLTKLKTCLLSRGEKKSDVGVLEEQQLGYKDPVSRVEDYIACVNESSVRHTLLAQISDIL